MSQERLQIGRQHDTLVLRRGDVCFMLAGYEEKAAADVIERLAWDHERINRVIEIDETGRQRTVG